MSQFKRTVQTTKNVTVNLSPINDRWSLFQCAVTTIKTIGQRKPTVKRTTHEGITDAKGIRQLKNGVSSAKWPTLKRDKSTSSIVACRPEMLILLRKKGWMGEHPCPEDVPESEMPDLLVDKPWTAQEQGDELVFIEMFSAGHLAFTLDGAPLPVCKPFDYTMAQFDNRSYDLAKAVSILEARSDVRLYPPDRHSKNLVTGIPHYNADGERTHQIAFFWYPEVEDYRRVIAEAQNYNRGTPNTFDIHRACFELDLFGLRAGGAARFDNYYGGQE